MEEGKGGTKEIQKNATKAQYVSGRPALGEIKGGVLRKN